MTPRRYQLNKRATAALESGHPWIFRKHMSSAASVFPDGQWLQLVDGANRVVGHGFYHRRGSIAIRILGKGDQPFRSQEVRRRVEASVSRRAPLCDETNAYRVVHGENDQLPAVTVDRYDTVAVVSSYAAGADGVARLAARYVRGLLNLSGVLLRAGKRRLDAAPSPRVVFGEVPETIGVKEDGQRMVVSVRIGQKGGTFLDLRGLRRLIRGSELQGKSVLDLFSYTGSLGAAAELAGAARIWHVDSSASALALGEASHTLVPDRHRWVQADAFEWVRKLDRAERFDLVLVDPPQMTSQARQVPRALVAYRRLYQALAPRVSPDGILVACCCTSRIEATRFQALVAESLGSGFHFLARVPAELDHPVRFPEADYLKVLVFRRGAKAL
ncbi:MAG TPA: class I SAM-dependent methyltransferase [Vicinamibacteria bacterium]|nr:class I SAM-dependent methyltransferase [Vicinamibacteria bacterium]